ncbi:DUF4865 family protein [Aeromonas bivalvium]|uniref:DUF4865 family protein n=1 Tax=Aeromonas bivalvium TaxID=440079 RepID=UPI0038D01279
MIAMHYRFTLPADYDMGLIEARIANHGAKLDGFPGLLFKAYLYSRQDDGALPGQENRYAPFYVWHSAEAMHRFLSSEGFAALTRHFGWPRIQTWQLLRAPDPASLDGTCMTRLRRTRVSSHDQLTGLHGEAMVSGWDLSRWEWLEADFLPSLPSSMPPEAELYRIGYLAKGRGE